MYDAGEAKTFGRQHGSEDALTSLTGAEAREIPVAAFCARGGTERDVRTGPDGSFSRRRGMGRFLGVRRRRGRW